MARWMKITGIILLLLVVLLIGAVFAIRNVATSVAEVEQVPGSENVYRVSNQMVQMYLIDAGGKGVMIDAGLDSTGEVLNGVLQLANIQKDQITDVFITHGHTDHINGLSLLEGVNVFVGEADQALMQGKKDPGAMIPTVMSRLFNVSYSSATHLLESRAEVPLPGQHTLLAIPFPGHTEGTYLYYHNGVLFGGDAFVYADGKLGPPPAPATTDMEQAKQSISTLPELLKGLDIVTICPGHSACTPPGQAAELIAAFAASMQ